MKLLVLLNIATVVFSLVACGFSAASIISSRRTARGLAELYSTSAKPGDA